MLPAEDRSYKSVEIVSSNDQVFNYSTGFLNNFQPIWTVQFNSDSETWGTDSSTV